LGFAYPTQISLWVGTALSIFCSNLSNIIASGTALAQADADYTVNVDVTGLAPASRYFYQFEALGQTSPVGRTKTLPTNGVGHLRFAQVSCAKFNAGFFNAYSRIAARDDLDFLLHLGDYIYEASNKPPASQTPGADIGRPFEPLHECKTLEDYRRR
jgi:alkaline phosphatase D